MDDQWEVQGSRERLIGETPCWEVAFVKPDGNGHKVLMPQNILEWRAAEYGIDPTDTETLLDIVLHEPHLPVEEPGEDEPQAMRYTDGGPTLWEADSTTKARDAHLARVAACPVRIDLTGTELDPVRESHSPDMDRVETMRETVDVQRWIGLYGALPITPTEEDVNA
ncbi:hypothetical protein ACFCX0_03425 [Streptomyces sp. NPDC056352]|uniref:hypothetical protein n=1 Tax=Streptomyces sp. NPDC056352 TaxID=3345791 RepID=UPI0035E34493